jgi:glycosyltransferase involved in cell wall biosynthesis
MKLVLLDQFSDPGGAQQMLLDLLPGIRERGWDAVVGLPGEGPLFARVRELGFAAERIDCGPYGSGRKSAVDVARFFADTPGLARQIGSMARGADLVYINGPRLLPATSLARLQAPVVFHSHSFLAPGSMRGLAGWALRRMGASVIANCELVGAVWREYVERVDVVYNGVGGPPERGQTDLSTRPKMLACIGRIAPEKGQVEFVEAAGLIQRGAPECRFTIYGEALFSEVGAERYGREVRAHAAGLPVEFAGWVDDVYAALAETDILLVPSRAVEATTRVILEAYAAGVPVIAFPSGGIPEVVEDGRTGFLAGSVAEMARLAIELLRDPARRAQVSAAARECWERRFTLERYRRDVLGALERARRPRAPVRPLPPEPGRSRSA